MGNLINQFQMLCDETNMDYPVLVQHWKQTRVEKEKLDNMIKILQKKINSLEQSLNSKLDSAGVTELKLDDFIKTKTLLESHNLNMDDQGKGLKVLEELKGQGNDTANIIALIDEHGSLVKKNKDLNDLNKFLVRRCPCKHKAF